MVIIVAIDLIILAAHAHDFLLQAVAHPRKKAWLVEWMGQVQLTSLHVVGQQYRNIHFGQVQLAD